MSNSANSGINPFEVALTQLDEVSSMMDLKTVYINFWLNQREY